VRRATLWLPWFMVLAGCSGIRLEQLLLIPTDTPKPTATITLTHRPAATLTATPPTPTFTSTPTFIGGERLPTETATANPSQTHAPGTASATILPDDTSIPENIGFSSVTISEKAIYWGSCQPGISRVTAVVTEPKEVFSVVIFVRLRELNTTDSTPWSRGDAMNDSGDGTFTYNLNADKIDGHKNYRKAWVFYQLVATDTDGEVIGRTQVYTQSLSIGPCL